MNDNYRKAILFPGAFQAVKNYDGFEGVDIWMGEEFGDELKNSEYFIGHSGGASFAIHHVANGISQYILVNPLIKKQSLPSLFIRWLKFFKKEGIRKEKIIPVKHWLGAIKSVFQIARIDLLSELEKVPKENVTIIRGKHCLFCDDEAVEIIKGNGIKLIEVDAGHDWNENITKAVREIIN